MPVPFLEASILECVYLEIMTALYALHSSITVMPDITQLHLSMIDTLQKLIQDSLLHSPGIRRLLYNKWVRLLVFIVRQTKHKGVHVAAMRSLSQISGGYEIINSFAIQNNEAESQDKVATIYERVSDWNFMSIGCSSGVPKH